MIKFEKLPDNIRSKISNATEVLTKEENVLFAYLFGGLARGDATPLSDVDIAVYLKNIQNLANYKLSLFSKLADALDTSELDLVILNIAPTSLAGRILQSKRILVDKEPFNRYKYESVTLREFFDFKIKEKSIFLSRYGIG